MPLMKSKSPKAFSKNVSAEMDAGKPQKQALAIAYSVKRKAGAKKYATGGRVKEIMDLEDRMRLGMDEHSEHRPEHEKLSGPELTEIDEPMRKLEGKEALKYGIAPSDDPETVKLAHGGELESITDDKPMHDMEMHDLAEAIIRKHKAMHADGGEVEDAEDGALEDNAIESPADMWTHDDHGMKENYSEASALEDLDSPADSGMHGDEDEERSVADSVKRKMKRK